MNLFLHVIPWGGRFSWVWWLALIFQFMAKSILSFAMYKGILGAYINVMGLHIHSVWSGPLALIYITLSIEWFCKQTLKALISLCRCAGWSRHSLSAHALMSHFHNHAIMCELLYEKLFFQMCSSKVEIQGEDPEWFLRGFDLIILPYLPYVLGQTGLYKQCRPRSDAAECSIWSGTTLFVTHPAISHAVIDSKMDVLKRRIMKSVPYLSNFLKISPWKWNFESVGLDWAPQNSLNRPLRSACIAVQPDQS